MIDYDAFIFEVERLGNSLKKNGKDESADFFFNIVANFKSKNNVVEQLEMLKNSASMSQYVGFTHDEDCIFDKIYNLITQ